MKKFLVLGVLLVGGIVACKKDQFNEPTPPATSTEGRIKALVHSYQVQGTSIQGQFKPNAWVTMGADFSGAMEGGEIGCLFGNPFAGALIGGLAGSAISLLRSNGSPACDTCYVANLNNTWDMPGRWHNELLDSIMDNRSLYFQNDTVCLEVLTSKVKELVLNKYNTVFAANLTLTDVESMTPAVIEDIADDFNEYMDKDDPSMIVNDADLQFVLDAYFDGVNACRDKEEIVEFTEIMQNEIAISTTYTSQQIEVINYSLSIAKNSLVGSVN